MADHVQWTDEELLAGLASGDETAFLTLYRRRQPSIYRFALRMSGSPATADDVIQEVFLMVIRGHEKFDPRRGSVVSWLFGAARRQVLRRLSREERFSPLEDESEPFVVEADPLSSLVRQEDLDALKQAVTSLPLPYREAVLLCDLEELSYEEAARVLGCPVGTVRSRLSRGRALLIDKMRSRCLT